MSAPLRVSLPHFAPRVIATPTLGDEPQAPPWHGLLVRPALAAGTEVEADGKGLVTSDTPRTIMASEVEFETED